MEFLICLVAAMGVAFGAFAGFRAAPFAMLMRMLIAVVSLLVALRLWFLFSRWLGVYSGGDLRVIAVAALTLPLLGCAIALVKLRGTYIEEFEAVRASVLGSLLGALFGAITGAVCAAAALMAIVFAAPSFDPGKLPFPAHRVAIDGYRWLEQNLARVSEEEDGHTMFPTFIREETKDPAAFWE